MRDAPAGQGRLRLASSSLTAAALHTRASSVSLPRAPFSAKSAVPLASAVSGYDWKRELHPDPRFPFPHARGAENQRFDRSPCFAGFATSGLMHHISIPGDKVDGLSQHSTSPQLVRIGLRVSHANFQVSAHENWSLMQECVVVDLLDEEI